MNYLYVNGESAADPVISVLKMGEAYSIEIPEILGHSTKRERISGTMPAEDLVVEVIYYENAKRASGQCNDSITWTVYEDGTLVFRGTGEMPDYTSGGAPWAASAEQIKEIYIDARITGIGDYAFENCENLVFIDYGYSVSSIGAYAFSGCKSLRSLKLPEAVTVISEGAFSGCTGLQAVMVPDNITAIENNAFAGCGALVQATIGAKVTAIGENAFADCAKLSQIYFRGKPATLGKQAFGTTAGKYVYYYSSVSGWSDVITDGLWNGYTAVPYNALSKESFDGTNEYIIKVVDKHNTPLENAVVTLGGKEQPTNWEGMAYFVKPSAAVDLTVSCSDHITFTDEKFQASATQIMDVIELSDRPSVVQGVRVNADSIATSVKIVNCAAEESLQIAVSGYSKYKILRYELYQGGRLITTVKTEANNCTFSVKANAFEEGETVLVRMHTSDGQTVASALNIDVIKLASISEQQILSELSQLELSIGLGSMGDYKIPVSFAASGEEKVYAIVDGRTIRVGINLDIEAFKDKNEEKAKTAIHKMVDDSMKNFATGKPGLEYNLCGYVEIEYLGNGEYSVKNSYVKVGIAATLAFRAQASYLGIVGVYFKASLTGASTLELKISRFEPEEGFGIDELNFAMENTLGIEGGAYLLWGIGSAGLYGKAKMGFELGIIPELMFKSVYITGEFGAKWSALWGLYSDSCVIAAGDIYRWPEPQKYMAKRLAERVHAAQQDPNSYKPNDRAYLENRSPWLSGDYLQKNIYENVAPRIISCGNTTMMLWLDDNADRDAANFQTLYYSIYTNGTWSKPTPVDDNGTFDCEFDVYTDGKKIYVVYTEMVAQNPTVATLDVADEGAVTAFAGGVEVLVTVYDGSFGAPVQLTHNNACELLPQITAVNGKVTAAWIQTEMVTISGQTGKNALYTAVLDSNGWSDPTIYIGGQNAISDIEIVTLGEESYTVYLVDADGSGETKDDLNLVLGDSAGEMTTLDSGFVANVAFVTIGTNKALTWQNNGKIYMITQPGQKPVCLLPEAITAGTNYQMVSISETETLLTFVMNNYDAEGNACDGTDIYGVYISDSGSITEPVRLTHTDGYVNNYSAVYDEKLVVVFTETFSNVVGEDVETASHLRNAEIDFFTDISLVSLEHDPTEAQVNTEYELTLQLRNNGMTPINGVTVRLCDARGQLLYAAQCDAQLSSGANGDFTAVVVLPAELATAGYSVQVLPANGTDADLSDNSRTLQVTYADFAVAAEQKIVGEKNHISLAVFNLGNLPASATLVIYANDASGRKLTDLQTGQIEPGATEQYFVELNALLGADENQITCIAVCEQDPYQLNNTETVALLRIDDSAFVTDPEQVMSNPEISVNAVAYDKHSPSDIVVDITAGAEYFTGIDALVKGTDYTVAGNRITIKSSYVSGLDIGTHNLRIVFDFGYDTPVSRTLSVTVTDTTPEQLSGEIAISGDATVGNTVYAELSGLKPETARVAYRWSIDGIVVSDQAFYEIDKQDLGKVLQLTVCGVNGFAGEFSVEETVTAGLQDAPSAPVVSKVDSFSFTVVKTGGVEYSIDLETWQTSNVFNGLTPNTTYTVYARKAATETCAASPASYGVKVTTPKVTVQAPAAPEILTIGDTTVQLVQVDGVEYSIDRENWQRSGLFEGLSPNREYSFYARKAENETCYASPISAATVVTTKKSTVQAPAAPIVVMRSDTTVSLQWYAGYEYSMDGIHWQNEGNADWAGHYRFVGLSPNTEYSFYQRVAETDTTYASAISEPLVIRTWKSSVVAPPQPTVVEILPDGIVLEANEKYQYKLEPYYGYDEYWEQSTGSIWGTAEEPTVETEGWQDSNVFTGLKPNTAYRCYQRYKGTDTAYASFKSNPIHVTTVKYSQPAPESPVAESCTDTAIVLIATAGMEFSMDGISWQDSNLFEGLQPYTVYTFYARWKETESVYASPASAAAQIRTRKSDVEAPASPEVMAVGDTTVQLLEVEGMEYSIDQVNWQTSGLFEGLRPNHIYRFWARKAETETTYASPASVFTLVTTMKTDVGVAMNPNVQTIGDTFVQLVEDPGFEYSIDRENWQTSGLFSGLLPNREYSFYARKAETDTSYASLPSPPTIVTTRKSTVNAPEAPVLERTSDTMVTLQWKEGYEYSLDGIIWQDSNVFKELKPNTAYTFYVRWKETDSTYASAVSSGLIVTTKKSEAAKPAAPILELCDVTVIKLQWQAGYEYSMDGITWKDSAVFENLEPDTEYTFYQRTKETDTCYASAASDALTVRTQRKPVVVAVVNGQETKYPTLTEALLDVPARTTLRLLTDVEETITIQQDLVLDLNSFNLIGNITVRTDAVLSVMDSQTDDFTVLDESGYGKIVGTVEGVKAQQGYMMVTETDGVSFHRIDLNIHTMTLRPSVVGVYYQSNFAGDEIVAQNVACYGISFSVTGIPTEEALGVCSWYDTFVSGSGGNAANGTLLHGIMKQSNSEAINAANAELSVYGRAYILTKDGQYIFGSTVSRSLREQVELIDSLWNQLTPEQKVAVLAMYEDYKTVAEKWDIPNIQAAMQ